MWAQADRLTPSLVFPLILLSGMRFESCLDQQFSELQSHRVESPQRVANNIWVETEDLVQPCPIFDSDLRRVGKSGQLFGRVFAMRERWSHKRVLVAPPITIDQLPVKDCHTLLQRPAYWMCRSVVFWKVIGPTEFLVDPDVYGPGPGRRLGMGGAFVHPEILDRHSFRLFLCQHEIRGD